MKSLLNSLLRTFHRKTRPLAAKHRFHRMLAESLETRDLMAVIPSVISANTTLNDTGTAYTLASNVVINPGVTLTIDPNVTIQSTNNSFDFLVNGSIAATSAHFTGAATEIVVAGGGRLNLTNTDLTGNRVEYQAGSLGTVSNSSFGTASLTLDSTAVDISGTTFTRADPVIANPSAVPKLYTSNTFAPNSAITVRGNAASNATWTSQANIAKYVLGGSLTVNTGVTLGLNSGVLVETQSSFHDIIVNGTLDASGASFTGAPTDLQVSSGGRMNLTNGTSVTGAAVNYGTGSLGTIHDSFFGTALLTIDSSAIDVQDTSFSRLDAISTLPNIVPSLYDNTFQPGAAMYVHGAVTSDVAWTSTVVANYALNNTLTVSSNVTLTLQQGLQLDTQSSFHDIIVNGTLTSNGASFTGTPTDIQVPSGGRLNLTNGTTVTGASVNYGAGSFGTIQNSSFGTPLVTIDSPAIDVQGNVFMRSDAISTLPGIIPSLYDNTFQPDAAIYVHGALTSNVTWSSSVVANYALNNTLTVNPGFTLTMGSNVRLDTQSSFHDIIINGTLDASDASFTGAPTDIQVPGGGRLNLTNGSSVTGVAVNYGAGSFGTIQNSSLGTALLTIDSPQISAQGNVFTRSDAISTLPSLVPTLYNNNFQPDAAIYVHGVLASNVAWSSSVVANYVLNNTLTINSGFMLTMGPNVRLDTQSSFHDIIINGTIEANDASFTGAPTDIQVPSGGRLNLTNGSSVTGTAINYGAGSSGTIHDSSFGTTLLTIDSTAVDVQNSTFTRLDAVSTIPDVVPTLYDNTFQPGSAIYVHGSAASDATFQSTPTVSRYVLNNTLTINPGFTLTLQPGVQLETQSSFHDIVINGTLHAIGATFLGTSTDIYVMSGGRLDLDSGATVSAGFVGYQAGSSGAISNSFFGAPLLTIDSTSVTVDNSTFARLDPISTIPSIVPSLYDNTFQPGSAMYLHGNATSNVKLESTANLTKYVLNGGLTINSGVAMTLLPGVRIESTNSFYDIAVNGTLSAADVDFIGAETEILVTNTGRMDLQDSRVGGRLVTYDAGSTGSVTNTRFTTEVVLNSTGNRTLTNNYFVSGIVRGRGNAATTIDLRDNYWGTTDASQIELRVDHKVDNAAFPTILFTPSLTAEATAGFLVQPTAGLVTTEGGGTATFTVQLLVAPTADVTINLLASDGSEASISPASVTFTALDWATPQTVTVTGVNDAEDDGDVNYLVVTAPATSADPRYQGKNPVDLSLVNIDDDFTLPEIEVRGNGVEIPNADGMPSLDDHTDFGTVDQNSAISRTFTIFNRGFAPLNLSNRTVPGGFTITDDLAATIPAGGSDTFTIALDTASTGVKSGLIQFLTNDSDETPFFFAVTANVVLPAVPEVAVQGNGVDIADGDHVESAVDGTSIGNVDLNATVSRAFTVFNTGTAPLLLSGLSVPTGYSITEGLSSSIAAGGSDTFTIALDTATPGTRSGLITFSTNDANEPTFDFSIAASVIDPSVPEVTVQGNAEDIVDGDSSPSVLDGTDAGTVSQGATVQLSFVIYNTGTAPLLLSNLTVPAGYVVTDGLAGSIGPGAFDAIELLLDTSSTGLKAGQIAFSTNDADEDPFNFSVSANVVIPSFAEVAVSGNGLDILDGDATPSTGDGTDFGTVEIGTTLSRTFTVSNTGNSPMLVSALSVPAGFTITDGLAASIPAGGSDTLTLVLDTSVPGSKSGQISFNTNDTNEATFNFSIVATIVSPAAPEIAVQGNGSDIVDGDAAASAADGTDFGNVAQGGSASRTFTVFNTGNANLNLTLALPSGFSIVEGLQTSIAPNFSDSFTIQLNTATVGIKSGEIVITTNDPDENPYSFAITGNVFAVAAAPEIEVQGNAVNIADNDSTPTLSDFTDFGTINQGATLSRTFTVFNTGNAVLNLSGLTIPAGFTVIDSLAASIAPGGSDTISIAVNSSTTGTKNGVVSFNSDDANENPFNFSITAAVVFPAAPEIEVRGNNFDIPDGDATPQVGDGTDLGTANIGGSVSRSFQIFNTGTSALTLSGLSLPSGFTVVDGLAASIAPGGFDILTISLNTSTVGTKSGEISFTTNDGNESPFNFSITASVVIPPAAEIEVQGNGQIIIDGDTTPATIDHTDFGNVVEGTSASRTFTVRNTGTATLTLTNFSVPTGFTVTEGLSDSIAPGSFDTFTLLLDTSTITSRGGEVSVVTNDSDENPFEFTISANVISSDMTPPTVVSIVPANGSTIDVGPLEILVHFSEAMNQVNLSTSDISLGGPGLGMAGVSAASWVDSDTAKFTIGGTWGTGLVTVQLAGSNLRDLTAGNLLTPYDGSFTITPDPVPTLAFSGPKFGVPGLPLTFTTRTTDSPADTNAGFTYIINWGDGTPVKQVAGLAVAQLTHAYLKLGTFAIHVTAKDQHGHLSEERTATTKITTVYTAAGVLYVGGSARGEKIAVTPTEKTGKRVEVKINSASLGTFLPKKIVLFGNGGNDMIQMATAKIGGRTVRPNVPLQAFGGIGNDILSNAANRAASVLVGEAGKDRLTGSDARDILIGGSSEDTLNGGADQDILVAGLTSYDSNLLALDQLMATWNGAGIYNARRQSLLSSASTEAKFVPKDPNQNVFEDQAIDTLLGGNGTDWYLISTLAGKKDIVSGRVRSEALTEVGG